MKVIEQKQDLRQVVARAKVNCKTIGFVPTMGFLHDGHISLMRRAKEENDIVVASIFINPTQFGVGEDLNVYPRDRERDCHQMIAANVDIAFFPEVETIYPHGFTTVVEVEGPMTKVLCGLSRPTHFKGVTTVVAKLLNLVSPDRAYFGQKDAQQLSVIRQMVKDLDFDVQIVDCPIVREADGLAMSSRNAYLTPDQRSKAPVLHQSLCNAQKMIAEGERIASVITEKIEAQIHTVEDAVIDYVSIVNANTLEELKTIGGPTLIALAVKFGKTRLIDNTRLDIV
jgi:pantoate--beta-alanine ligase